MWKKNKRKIVVTSLLILLPIAVGLILWDRLPETVAIHFGTDNQPNGWSGKAFAVFGLPGILLALHLFCLGMTFADPKGKNMNATMVNLVMWVCPAVSWVTATITYAGALGAEMDEGKATCIFVGAVFLVLGNFLPKCEPNYSIGFRTPWALYDPENWHKTQRAAGWSMSLGGVAVIVAALLPIPGAALAAVVGVSLVFAALFPMAYSYRIFRKQG